MKFPKYQFVAIKCYDHVRKCIFLLYLRVSHDIRSETAYDAMLLVHQCAGSEQRKPKFQFDL